MDLPIDYHESDWKYRRAAREEYTKIQKGLCYYCKAPLTEGASELVAALPIDLGLFPPDFLKYPVHLHHSHDTGLTIGAVHCYCNAVLWQHHDE